MRHFLYLLFFLTGMVAAGSPASAQECVLGDVKKALTLAQAGQFVEIAAITQRCPTEVNVLLAYAKAGVMQAKGLNNNPEVQAKILTHVWTALDRIDSSGVDLVRAPNDRRCVGSVRADAAKIGSFAFLDLAA